MDNWKASAVPIDWHSELPIYASEPFLRSLGGEYGWVGGADDCGKLRCALPYTVMRKSGFRMVRFQTQTLPLGGELELSEERSFLSSVIEYFRSSGADMILPSGNTAIFRTYPEGAAAAPYGTILKDLTQAEDVVMNEIRKTFRQKIKKAATSGVQVKSGIQYLESSYALIAGTLERSGAKFKSYEEFKRRILAFGENVKIFVAEHEGVIQACLVSPFSDYAAYSCYAGSKPEPVVGATHLLNAEAMRQFRAMGVKRFDFQGVRVLPEKGSKQEGILTFKQSFGGKLALGYIWKYSLRPLPSLLYSVGVRMLMGGDLVDQEGHKLHLQHAPECGEVAVG